MQIFEDILMKQRKNQIQEILMNYVNIISYKRKIETKKTKNDKD